MLSTSAVEIGPGVAGREIISGRTNDQLRMTKEVQKSKFDPPSSKALWRTRTRNKFETLNSNRRGSFRHLIGGGGWFDFEGVRLEAGTIGRRLQRCGKNDAQPIRL